MDALTHSGDSIHVLGQNESREASEPTKLQLPGMNETTFLVGYD